MDEGSAPTRILYVINGFNRGGAEKGLLHLIHRGAFTGCSLRIVSIVAGQGAYVPELRAAGIPVEHFAASRDMTIHQWLLAVPRLVWRLWRHRPDIVILSLPQANIAGRIAALFHRRCIVASFEHNTHLAKPLYETLFRLTSTRVDWMLADCAATAREVAQRLYRRPPTRSIDLPLVSFPMRALDGGAEACGEPFTVVSAGRFTPVKNQRAMIEALATVRRRGLAARLVLFGEGELLGACQALAAELGISAHVDFPGFAPDWMDRPADAFLLSSQHEGLCIVALEAMSRGVPVIAPCVGGLRDYGEEARALLLDDVCPDTIADAIARLIGDAPLRAEMRAAGLRTAADRYGDEVVGRICGRFAALMRNSRGRSALESPVGVATALGNGVPPDG